MVAYFFEHRFSEKSLESLQTLSKDASGCQLLPCKARASYLIWVPSSDLLKFGRGTTIITITITTTTGSFHKTPSGRPFPTCSPLCSLGCELRRPTHITCCGKKIPQTRCLTPVGGETPYFRPLGDPRRPWKHRFFRERSIFLKNIFHENRFFEVSSLFLAPGTIKIESGMVFFIYWLWETHTPFGPPHSD